MNILSLARDVSHLLILAGNRRIAVPVAIVQLAATAMAKDYYIPIMTAGFMIPGIAGILTGRIKWVLIGISLGCELAPFLIRETNMMIQNGCNPPAGKSILEQYMFCKLTYPLKSKNFYTSF